MNSITVLLINILVLDNAFHSDSTNDAIMIERIERVLAVKTPGDNLEAYHELFHNLAKRQIPALKHHPNIGIGIRSAWEDLMRKLVENDKAEAEKPSESNLLHYFAGFVEGRLDCEIPEWWKKTLLSAKANGRDNFRFTLPHEAFLRSEKNDISGLLKVENMKAEEPLIIPAGHRKVIIPASVIKQMYTNQLARYFFTGERIYLAWHMDAAGSYHVYCLDPKSNKIDWTAKIWADGGHVLYTGIGNHVLTFVNTKDRLIVFGASESCVYVEGLKKDNGKNVYRFSTGY